MNNDNIVTTMVVGLIVLIFTLGLVIGGIEVSKAYTPVVDQLDTSYIRLASCQRQRDSLNVHLNVFLMNQRGW